MGMKRSAGVVGLAAVGAAVMAGCDLGARPVTYEMNDDTSWPISPTGLDSGDIDADGDVDVVVTGSAGMGSVVLVNDGTGTFVREPGRAAYVGSSASPSLVDMDGDGDLDLLTSVDNRPSSERVPAVTPNDGTGRFGPIAPIAPGPVPGELTDVAPSDADGDGDLDILAAFRVEQERHVGVYLNDGTGTFANALTYPLGLTSDVATPILLVAGDLDGDGDDDVVATDVVTLPETGEREVHAMVALNDGSGAYTAGTPFRASYPEVSAPALVDFTGDGALDLVVGRTTFPGDGTGGFGEPVDLGSLPWRYDLVASADVDSDGHVDLVGFGNTFEPQTATIGYGDGQGGVAQVHGVDTGTAMGGDGTLSRQIELADIDGDGDPDVLFLAGSLGVLENVIGRPES